MDIRPRRNRKSQSIRSLIGETKIMANDLVYPLFIHDRPKDTPIDSMPGQSRLSLQSTLKTIESCLKKDLSGFILFPCIEEIHKDKTANYSWKDENFYLQAVAQIKKEFPQTTLITDVAMDPYSSDGHDGLVDNANILNDESLEILGKMSLAQAQAGADILGPSDMMDGRIEYIREVLDDDNFKNTSLMSYTCKYASSFYGPFRQALDSAPKNGDKKTYQMDFSNRREALREAMLDESEGADFLMVKPAMSYLDIISDLKQHSSLPIVAYNVSGEYAMVKAAAQNGWVDEKAIVHEILTSIKRAGADIILSYFAKDYLDWTYA